MERHRCKICCRNFANGRALGGHMRSHMMNFYAAKNPSKEEEDQIPSDKKFQENDEFQSVHSYSSSSSSSSEEEGCDEEEENPRKRPCFLDQELSFALQDIESETESSRNKPFCRRSKRVRKSRISYSEFAQLKKSKLGETNEQSPLSSISETTPEEDVAYCLMMLSRDKWKRENDHSEDSGVAKVKKTKVRGKYRCETCSKSFRSYQALGGHRASHKKIKVNEAAAPGRNGGGLVAEAAAAVVEEKIHECPFCRRVFASGQALGGHKRSHFIGAPAISANVSHVSPVKGFTRIGENLGIDLNLPAPIDDDDDEISH